MVSVQDPIKDTISPLLLSGPYSLKISKTSPVAAEDSRWKKHGGKDFLGYDLSQPDCQIRQKAGSTQDTDRTHKPDQRRHNADHGVKAVFRPLQKIL